MAKNEKPSSEWVLRKNILESINRVESSTTSRYRPALSWDIPAENYKERAERERLELLNQQLKVDIELKKATLNRLFWFLGTETVIIFIFTFMQATKLPRGFFLEDWSFRLIIAATITQITLMLKVAVEHLFPKHEK